MSDFTPEFAAVDFAGSCTYVPPEGFGPGERVAMVFAPSDTHPIRRITVHFDSTGVVTYYSDVRGDVSEPQTFRASDGSVQLRMPAGRRTEIEINVEKGFGLARNTGGDRPEQAAAGPADVMMHAVNLGTPIDVAATVRARCH